MTNVFIVPAASPAARENLERTVAKPVRLDRLAGLSSSALRMARAAPRGVTVWGTKPGTGDRHVKTWEAMESGDWVLFYSEKAFPFAGRVLVAERSPEVAERLWDADEDGQTWECLYLMDELRQLGAPPRPVTDALSYEPGSYPRGFVRVARDLAARHGSVERMLAELAEVGEVLEHAVDAVWDGDAAAAVVAIDSLADRLPDKTALAEAVAGRTASSPPRVRKEMQRRFERDRKLALDLKALYDGRCQCCGFTFAKADGTPYSEAAHLRRISLGEADLDVKDNILVLCPNHHKMLDLGPIEIEYDAESDRLLLHENGETEEIVNKHIGPGRPGWRRKRK